MAVTQSASVPYAPASAVLEIINRRRHRSLPIPINADVLGRAGISASLIPRTLQTLQTLDLTDEGGNPTEIFEGLRTSPEAEFQLRMGEWIKAAYSEVFSFVDPSQDDEIRIRDAFRSYNPAGQQDRMVSLFVGLCMASGIIKEKPATAAPRAAGRSIPRINTTKSAAIPKRSFALKSPMVQQPPLQSGSMPPALAGILAQLPDPDRGWTQNDREKFYHTFGAVLDFCIPIRTKAQINEDGGPE